MKNLTTKQELFCQKILEFGNDSEAYRAAYKATGMKSETIHVKANEMKNKGKIRVRLAELQEQTKKRNDVTTDRIIQELKLIAFFDPRSLFNDNGELKDIKDMPDEVARAISEIKREEIVINKKVVGVKTTIKLHSKLEAIEKLARHIGFYKKDNEQQNLITSDSFLNLMKAASATINTDK